MSTPLGRILDRIAGTGLPLHGDDVDTDRILPARYLRVVSFEGIEAHVFEDDRASEAAAGRVHAFEVPAYAKAAVLLVNSNFGCGSSREHAPQALQRRGVRVIVGESFSEIFFGNAAVIGLPCVTADHADLAWLQALAEAQPQTEIVVSLGEMRVRAGGRDATIRMPAANREACITGQWDATGLLLDDYDRVREVAARLPYLRWGGAAS